MATRTSNIGLYNWVASDDIEVTVPQQSANADLLETRFRQREVSVKDYAFGAKGDMNLSTQAGTDDTAAFQKALDLAKPALASVNIFIPDGIYKMTSELKFYSNTTITCGPNVRVVRAHAGYLAMNGNRSTETSPSTAPGYTGRGNISIYGGDWDGNGGNQSSKAAVFHLGHGDKINFIGALVRDCANSHHIEFNACKNIYVENCKFLGWFGSTDDFNEAIQLDISKGTPTIGPGDNTPCENVWILNNHFGDSGTTGANHIARAFGSHTSTIGVWHKNVNFIGNTVKDCLSFAVRLYSTKNFTVTGNNFVNVGAGINVRTPIVGTGTTEDTKDVNGVQTGGSQTCEGGDISGNVFEGGMTAGRCIELYGETSGRVKGVSVANNTITLSRSTSINDAICLHQTEDSTVIGNRIYGAFGAAVIVKSSSYNNTIFGNTMDDIGRNGIHVEDSFYTSINGNTISRVQNSGIYFSAGEMITIAGNTISGANGVAGSGNTYNHVRGVSATLRVSITGNTFRNYSTTYVTTHAVYLTNTVQDVAMTGNMGAGFTLFVGTTDAARKVTTGNLGTVA